MLDVRCWILDVGCWMLDVGYWMLDVGCWMMDIHDKLCALAFLIDPSFAAFDRFFPAAIELITFDYIHRCLKYLLNLAISNDIVFLPKADVDACQVRCSH